MCCVGAIVIQKWLGYRCGCQFQLDPNLLTSFVFASNKYSTLLYLHSNQYHIYGRGQEKEGAKKHMKNILLYKNLHFFATPDDLL